MSQVVGGQRLIDAMIAEQLVPDNCTHVTVDVSVEGLVLLQYQVVSTDADLAALGRAFLKAAKVRGAHGEVQG